MFLKVFIYLTPFELIILLIPSSNVLIFFPFLQSRSFCLSMIPKNQSTDLRSRNQSIDLRSKSLDWFLYDNGLHHEGVNLTFNGKVSHGKSRYFEQVPYLRFPFLLCNTPTISSPSIKVIH